MKKAHIVNGWCSGSYSDMLDKGDSINCSHVSYCSNAMHTGCVKEKECQLEHRKAWSRGNWGARCYLGLNDKRCSFGNLTEKQKDKIKKKCQARLKKCRKAAIRYGDPEMVEIEKVKV